MRAQWITHKGQEILFADYSDLGNDFNTLAESVTAVNSLAKERPTGTVRVLIDVTNLAGTTENLDILKENAKAHKHMYLKSAVIGVEGYRKILLRAIISFSRMSLIPFDDIDSAKDWLAE